MPLEDFVYLCRDEDCIKVRCNNCDNNRRIKISDIDLETGEIRNGAGVKCGYCKAINTYVIDIDFSKTNEAPLVPVVEKPMSIDEIYEQFPVLRDIYQSDNPVQPQDNTAKCPRCNSTSLCADKKGFGFGKAIAGALLAGPIGLLAGGIGAKKMKIYCMSCGYEWKP